MLMQACKFKDECPLPCSHSEIHKMTDGCNHGTNTSNEYKSDYCPMCIQVFEDFLTEEDMSI